MKYQYELRLDVKKEGEFHAFDCSTIKADNIIGLLSQFNLLVVMLMRKMHENELTEMRTEDDIPF